MVLSSKHVLIISNIDKIAVLNDLFSDSSDPQTKKIILDNAWGAPEGKKPL